MKVAKGLNKEKEGERIHFGLLKNEGHVYQIRFFY
jgi:hypothetical protein